EAELCEALAVGTRDEGGLDEGAAGMLHELEGGEPVQESEGALAHVALGGLPPGSADRLVMSDGGGDGLPVGPPNGVEVQQVVQWLEHAAGVDAVGTFPLRGEILFQQPPAADDDVIEEVALFLFHYSPDKVRISVIRAVTSSSSARQMWLMLSTAC